MEKPELIHFSNNKLEISLLVALDDFLLECVLSLATYPLFDT
jgi:hypothetical protein